VLTAIRLLIEVLLDLLLLLRELHSGARRLLSLQESLVVFGLPLILEPVHKHLEGSQILLVEVEAHRSHLDELLDHAFARHISEYDVLLVVGQDSKAVGNTGFVRCFLVFELLLELFPLFTV
jgi:hypothetical protein